MGFEYERLRRELLRQTRSLMRPGVKDDSERQDDEFQNAIEDLARQIEAKFDALREKEVDLYVTGPVNMVDPEKEKAQKKLWRRLSG